MEFESVMRGRRSVRAYTSEGDPESLLRPLLPGADEKQLVIAVTIGWPQADVAVNASTHSRAPVDELVTWVS